MIKAGVTLMTKFVLPNSSEFSSYVDYIDRDEAVRNDNIEKFNTYMDYMGNPEKTTELFTADKDFLNQEEKSNLKKIFQKAQDNDSLMWQTVISFDNEWLENNGLYDSENKAIDQNKLKEITRNSMNKMLQKEGISQSAIWSAAIHYNTDNVHIHIATTEVNSLRPKMPNGEYRGVWKLSTLDSGRSTVVNNILSQQQENQLINDMIRKKILEGKKDHSLLTDKELKKDFLEIYNILPDDKRQWNYASNILGNDRRKKIDALSKKFLDKYFKEEIKEIDSLLKVQEDKYRTAYGTGSKISNNFAENKKKDLYKRLGNSILKEMKYYDKMIKENSKVEGKSRKKIKPSVSKKNQAIGNEINRSLRMLKRTMQKDIKNFKNQVIYESLQREVERENMDQGR